MNVPNILVLCTGNSCRSQMAEAFLRKHAAGRFNVYSAGTDPHGVNPLTIAVLREIGLPTEDLRSKDVTEFGDVALEYLIAVCGKADQACPAALLRPQHRLYWPFDDPAGFKGTPDETLAEFRRIRDEVESKIVLWLEEKGKV